MVIMTITEVPPSGGSLEIGNDNFLRARFWCGPVVPPSGGSLEIGNFVYVHYLLPVKNEFPLRGDP